jgi:hypothetical protein
MFVGDSSFRVVVFLFVAVCYTTSLHAQQTIGPVGSPSGGSRDYVTTCPVGEFLVGMRLRTGWYVDNIELICASFDASGNPVIETLDENGDGVNDIDDSEITDGGETTTTLLCPDNSVINQFGGRAGAYLDALGARCVNVDGTGNPGLNITGGSGGNDFNLFCPGGSVATGISGRSGWWIDSASFVCNPLCLQTPPNITLLNPPDGGEASSNQPTTFAWSIPGTGFLIGQRFQLCVSSSADNACDVLNGTTTQPNINVPASSLTFSGTGPLFWTVRAVNSCGVATPFANARALFSPGNGTVVGSGPDYRPLCAVYKDDRCSICHGGPAPVGHPIPFPQQNDAQGRFNDDNCTGCHFVVHPDNGLNVWEFPPGAADEVANVDLQTFADPATCGDICRSVRNWAEEHDFIHHIEVDPLVASGFDPTTVQGSAATTLNTRPPVEVMNHQDYVDLSTSWYRAGMPCDPVTDDFPSGAVSAASGPGDGRNGGGTAADKFDTKLLDKLVTPPEAVTLWWIKGLEKPLPSGKPTGGKRLPLECQMLIRRPSRPTLSSVDPIRSREKEGLTTDLLRKECLKIMKRLEG